MSFETKDKIPPPRFRIGKVNLVIDEHPKEKRKVYLHGCIQVLPSKESTVVIQVAYETPIDVRTFVELGPGSKTKSIS